MRDLPDTHWEVIRPLLPPPKNWGQPRADDRRTLNGSVYMLRTGCRWGDLSRRSGSPVTCWRRLRQWQEAGVWERIWRTLLAPLEAQGKREWARACWAGTFLPAKQGAKR